VDTGVFVLFTCFGNIISSLSLLSISTFFNSLLVLTVYLTGQGSLFSWYIYLRQTFWKGMC
jgi:hypothetical protein